MTTTLKRILPLFAFFIMLFVAKAENKVLWEFEDPNCTMFCCKFSPDEKYIIHTIGTESSVVVRDIESGKELRRSKSLGFTAYNMHFSEDGTKIILSSILQITILDIKTLEVLSTFAISEDIIKQYPTGNSNHRLELTSFYDNDKSIIAVLSVPVPLSENLIFVQINPKNTKDQKIIKSYNTRAYDFVQSPDRKMIALSTYTTYVDYLELFDLVNQKPYWSYKITDDQNPTIHYEAPTVTWSKDSKYCVTTGYDAVILDVEKKSEFYRFNKANQEKFGLIANLGNMFVPSKNKLINSSLSLKAIDIPSLQCQPLIKIEDSYVYFWRYIRLNSNETIIMGNDEASIKLYQISDISGVNVSLPQDDDFTIYPNPSSEFCYIDLHGSNIQKLLLASSNGENMTDRIQYKIVSDSKFEINTSSLPKGMYFISLVIDKYNTLKYKLIKE